MRIISGEFKGKKIIQPLDKSTRPLKDLTKESIFNIINHSNLFSIDITESHVLDLFAGVGSFGLECISRGAKKVTFIENYSKVLPILKKNIINIKSSKKIEIIEKNIFIDETLSSLKKRFNIIFIDAPYKEKKVPFLLDKIYELNLLKKNGILIIHTHKSEKNNFSVNFKILSEKTYGISKIIFGN